MYVILRSVPRTRNPLSKHEFVGLFTDVDTALKETLRLDIRQPFFEYKVIACDPDTLPNIQTSSNVYDTNTVKDTFPDVVHEENIRKQESTEKTLDEWHTHVRTIKTGYVIDKLQILYDTVSWFRDNPTTVDKRRSGEIKDILTYFDTIDTNAYLDKDQSMTLSEIKSDAFIFSERVVSV